MIAQGDILRQDGVRGVHALAVDLDGLVSGGVTGFQGQRLAVLVEVAVFQGHRDFRSLVSRMMQLHLIHRAENMKDGRLDEPGGFLFLVLFQGLEHLFFGFGLHPQGFEDGHQDGIADLVESPILSGVGGCHPVSMGEFDQRTIAALFALLQNCLSLGSSLSFLFIFHHKS